MGIDESKYRGAEQRLWDVEGAHPEECWLDLPRTGSRVRVQVVGDGPPVLFVHGVGNSGTSWAPLVARLGGFRCLVLDRPGCGLSEPLDGRFDVDRFVPFAESLLVEVLDGMNVDSAHIVATSLGGYHALRTAAAHPQRVRGVAELGWTVGAPIEKTPIVVRLGGVRAIARLMSRMPVNDRLVRSMLGQIGLRSALDAGRVPDELVDWWRVQMNHTDTMRNEVQAGPPIMQLRGLNDSVLLADDVLSRVQAPVWFRWGADDPFGGPEVASAFVARIPNGALDLVPGGHAVWIDDPDGTADATATFLGTT